MVFGAPGVLPSSVNVWKILSSLSFKLSTKDGAIIGCSASQSNNNCLAVALSSKERKVVNI